MEELSQPRVNITKRQELHLSLRGFLEDFSVVYNYSVHRSLCSLKNLIFVILPTVYDIQEFPLLELSGTKRSYTGLYLREELEKIKNK